MADTNIPTLRKLDRPFCTQKDKMADANFPLIHFSVGSVSPPRLLGSFPHLGVGTHKCLKHLCVTFLHSQKVPKKVHQNRLTHLWVAVVNRLGNSRSHQIYVFKFSIVNAQTILPNFCTTHYFSALSNHLPNMQPVYLHICS